jgi:uncharacterized protein
MLIQPGETLVLEITGHFAGPLTPPRSGQAGPDTSELPARNAAPVPSAPAAGRFGSCVFLPIVL